MWHLYRKEFRRLLPFLFISLLLFAGNLLEVSISRPLDDVSWISQMSQLEPSDGRFHGVLVIFMAMLFAYGAFPREHEEGTIEFLYALPISRRQIFLAKWLGAWTLMAIGLVAEQGVGWLLQAANRQSMTGEQFRFDLAWQSFALSLMVAAIGVSHGLLLSYARRFGWLIYGLLALMLVMLGERRPAFQILDPTRLSVLQYDGREMIWPWTGLAVQGVLALAVCVGAYLLWMTTGEEVERLYGLLRRRIWGRVVLGCSSTLLVIMVIGWIFWVGNDGDFDEGPPVAYRSFQTTHLQTEHYRLSFSESMGTMARALVSRADAIYEALVEDLADPQSGPIVAQLDIVRSNHLGVELGGVLRASLSGDAAQDDRVFAHETAHVFQWHLAQRRRLDAASVRFFLEGSADFLATRRYAAASTREANGRLAAAVWDRHSLDFADLLDAEELGKRFDEGWVYVLGERWTAALVDHCGDDAILRVLRAMGRADAPEDLSGIALWQDTLRAAGCDLEATLATWHQLMADGVAAHRQAIDRLPRLSGGPQREDDAGIHFVVELDRHDIDVGSEFFVRLRRDANAGPMEMMVLSHTWSEDDQVAAAGEAATQSLDFVASRRQLGGGPFEYQMGQRSGAADWALFEEWQYAASVEATAAQE